MSFDIKRFFPFDTIREQQQDAIDFTLDAFLNKKKRFVVLELGTGVGKSAVALTVAKYIDSVTETTAETETGFLPGAYFLTTQKILQEQYMSDFGAPKGKLVSIKSSENYECRFNEKSSCGESMRAIPYQKGTPFFHACMNNCRYRDAKKAFINSREGITNFSYFLAESKYAGKITPRDLLVIDEAHNIELELSKFIELTISERFATTVLKVSWPQVSTEKAAVKWLIDVYKPKLVEHMKHIQGMLEKYSGLKEKLNELTNFSKQNSLLDKHVCKINRFLEIFDEENWVLNIIEASGKSMQKLEFKPIDVSKYADEALFRYGQNVILMSATILDKDAYCQSLGISQSDVEFLSVESPFPPENRPVFYVPVGKMGKDDLSKTLPKLASTIKSLLEQHKNDRGVIHCHTYQISSYLKQNIKSRRLLVHDSLNKEEILKKHADSKNSVLLSPSSTEGLDLKDDLSRFQIICKLPFPFLGDKLVRKRMKKHSWWYPYQTTKTIIQALGRSVRNQDDHAVSYILDGNWQHFYDMNCHLFPISFKKVLQ